MGLSGNGGCLLIKLGVTRLSQLAIDADKDWGGHGISNLKGLTIGMQRGDILQRGNSGVLEGLAPGPIGFEITSNGPGHEVEWQAPPTP
jgi:hypothetical protein